jgi:hypothetical protein
MGQQISRGLPSYCGGQIRAGHTAKNYGQIFGHSQYQPDLKPAFGSGDQFTPDTIYCLRVSGPSRIICDLSRMAGKHAFKI